MVSINSINEKSEKTVKFISIAIDGPSGAGKSSLAKNLAVKLGFAYLDTGALYRAVGLYVFEECGGEYNLNNLVIDAAYIDGVQRVFLNECDVSEKIRENRVSKYASDVSKVNKVREFLLQTQRDAAKKNNVIMDGRDIGTVILPDADLKIFLTASPEKRAERRYNELIEKGQKNIDYSKILKEITQRDEQDSNRDIAPLKPAHDAVILDNSDCDSPNASLEKALEIIKEHLPYVGIR